MSEINWGLIATEWKRGGVLRALDELKRQGHTVVPLEPTRDMILEGMNPAIPGSVSEIYREMIRARPDVMLKEFGPASKWDAAATLVLK